MLFRTLGVLGKRFAQAFLPSKILGLQLWLDATDTTTLNAKMGADFTGGSSMFLQSDATVFNKGNEDYSLGGWVKAASYANTIYWINSRLSGGDNNYQLVPNANNVNFVVTGVTLTTSATALVDGSWHFIVGVYDSVNDLMKVSIDGNPFETKANATGSGGGAVGFTLGKIKNFSTCTAHQTDAPFFYDKALTIAQVGVLYASGSGIAYSNLSADSLTSLVSWWDLNELSGTRFDAHASNDLTDNNSVTYALGHVQEPITANDYVWRWTDKSANGYNFDQDTGLAQPKYVSNGYGTNSKAHLLFDNLNDFLVNSAFAVGDATVFIVYKDEVAKSGATLIADEGEKGNLRTYSNAGTSMFAHSNPAEVHTGVATVLNTNYAFMFSRQPTATGTSYTRLNGGSYVSKEFTNSDITSGLKIGNWYTTTDRFFGGQIAEILIYDNVLTNAHSDQVFDYINTKYGIY